MIIEEEGSAKQEGSEAVVEPIAKNSDTKMSNQVVQPMSRGKYSESTTVTSSGNVVRTTEVITKGNGGVSYSYNKTITSGDDIAFPKCCACCACLGGCAVCILCIPCMVLGMVVNCLLCPVNTAIGCCCPSRAQVAFPAFHDKFSMFD